MGQTRSQISPHSDYNHDFYRQSIDRTQPRSRSQSRGRAAIRARSRSRSRDISAHESDLTIPTQSFFLLSPVASHEDPIGSDPNTAFYDRAGIKRTRSPLPNDPDTCLLAITSRALSRGRVASLSASRLDNADAMDIDLYPVSSELSDLSELPETRFDDSPYSNNPDPACVNLPSAPLASLPHPLRLTSYPSLVQCRQRPRILHSKLYTSLNHLPRHSNSPSSTLPSTPCPSIRSRSASRFSIHRRPSLELPVPEPDAAELDDEVDAPFSPLLSLPLEVLYRIIEIVYYDSNLTSINANLESFCKTVPLLSKKLHQLSLCFLYKYTIFNRPHSFDKLLHNLLRNPRIGQYVEYMDFQQFTSIGLGRTGRMNQEIQMVTSTTIASALELTPNLIEFLASENIQDDMDIRVMDILFNHLPKLQAIDFCGASSLAFVLALQRLVVGECCCHNDTATATTNVPASSIDLDDFDPPQYTGCRDLLKLSFHDCTSLTVDVFAKILCRLPLLRRLDLNHTSITSSALLSSVQPSVRLTHLSLARCSKLTTRDLIQFLTQHPAVSQASLQWLNLQIDLNVVSPLLDVYLLFTLRNLNAPNLKYLNLGGLPTTSAALALIKTKFVHLESLNISHASLLTLENIQMYLENNTALRFIDLTGLKKLSRWNVIFLLKNAYGSNLEAIEFDYKVLFDLSANGTFIRISPVQQLYILDYAEPELWRFYDNEGRRLWLYRMSKNDPDYKLYDNRTGSRSFPPPSSTQNLVYYDLETGDKIVSKVTKPLFLKFASRKINCSIGYQNISKARLNAKGKFAEDVWPTEFSQRGIYNYYSLNIK